MYTTLHYTTLQCVTNAFGALLLPIFIHFLLILRVGDIPNQSPK
jgi:hypothetical protein